MRLPTMFFDILRALFSKPATQRYPNPEPNTPERLRGKLYWNPERCTGCALCVKDCPADAIQLITLDKENKRFVMRYDVGRCTFCGQCVQSCRFDCLDLSSDEWSLAAVNRTPFTIYYGDKADVAQVMENATETVDTDE